MDLLNDLRGAVDKAVSTGSTLADFRKDFDTIVAKHGWTYNGGRNWRSRVIYATNIRASYQAGRYAQMQQVKHFRPYWRYVHQDGERHPRPIHLSWTGLVLHADDPWWDGHYPPGGWGCKCTVETLASRDLERMGKVGPDTAPPSDPQQVTIGTRGPNPRTVTTPRGIDPGFGHLQGKTSLGAQAERYIEKSAMLPPTVAAQAVLDLTSRRRIVDGLAQEFRAWLGSVGVGATKNDYFAVGAIEPKLMSQLKAHGIELETAAILIRDTEAAHMLRPEKVERTTPTGLPKSLAPDQIADLPRHLVGRRAVLLDPASGDLLYVFDAPQRTGKAILRVNFRGKLARLGKQTFNSVRTASLVDDEDISKEVRAGRLMLLEGKL
ncbi:MAG: phage minor head protein [Sinobacteraceae bacterium]|nr:phage minor head protein [Nevskiaceae bacterium]